MKRHFKLLDVLVWCVESLLIGLALLYLAEYFDLPVVREAGGGLV